MGAIISHHGLLLAGSGATSSYNTVVSALSPDWWWRLEETSGTTATDSAASPHNGTLNGGATFAGSGVSVSAPSGYAGLGKGVDFGAASVKDITNAGSVALYGTSTSSWTAVLWLTGASGSSQYALSRANDAAIIYGFTADTVEFFSIGFSGSDPRTGSGITLTASDTTTPHMIVYRYSNGTWSGFKDGSQVFSVSRSFGLPLITSPTYLGSDSSTNVYNGKCYDAQFYARALSGSEIANIYAARNNP
jgi:hypothetical protein